MEKPSFVLRNCYLFRRSQIVAGDEQLSQIFNSVLLLPLELIFFLQELGQNLLLRGCGLSN